MDLVDLNWDTSAEMTLKHPATGQTLEKDDGTPMTIAVSGSLSPAYRRASFEAKRAMIQDSVPKAQTYEWTERFKTRMLASLIVSWDIQLRGSSPAFCVETAVDLLTDHPWIADQIDAFAHTPGNFSAVSSSS